MTWRTGGSRSNAGVAIASPGPHGAIAAPASSSRGPAARWIAPSTPPPPSRDSLAAVTIASASCAVMSPSTTSIAAMARACHPPPGSRKRDMPVADMSVPGLSQPATITETGPVTGRLRVREIDDDEGRRLVRIVRRGSGSVVTWRRAQMVLLSAQGMDAAAIAKVAFTSQDRVRDVIRNFNADGFSSLYPRYKGGHPPKFTLGQRREIKKIAKSRPAEHDLPFSTWSLAKLADFLVAEGVVDDISHEGLRLLLRAEGVTFQRLKTWKGSKDPRYAEKKARVEQLYAIADRQAVPAGGDPEVIFCVDLCRHRNYAEGLRCRF